MSDELIMYFVTDHQYDGGSNDWFVNARTPEEAFAMWRIYKWTCEGEELPPDERNITVFAVPLPTATPEIMDWPHYTATQFPLHFDNLTTLAVLAEFELSLQAKGKDDA